MLLSNSLKFGIIGFSGFFMVKKIVKIAVVIVVIVIVVVFAVSYLAITAPRQVMESLDSKSRSLDEEKFSGFFQIPAYCDKIQVRIELSTYSGVYPNITNVMITAPNGSQVPLDLTIQSKVPYTYVSDWVTLPSGSYTIDLTVSDIKTSGVVSTQVIAKGGMW